VLIRCRVLIRRSKKALRGFIGVKGGGKEVLGRFKGVKGGVKEAIGGFKGVKGCVKEALGGFEGVKGVKEGIRRRRKSSWRERDRE